MRPTRQEAIRAIYELIGDLAVDISESERLHGWDESKKKRFLEYLKNLQSRLAHHLEESRNLLANISITRTLDDWGIEDGEIMDRAARISRLVRGMAGTDDSRS
jgi:hypothetical protein